MGFSDSHRTAPRRELIEEDLYEEGVWSLTATGLFMEVGSVGEFGVSRL